MKGQILRAAGKAGVGPELKRNPAPEGSRRVSPFLRSREGDFHQLTPTWMHGVGHSQSMDATAFLVPNPRKSAARNPFGRFGRFTGKWPCLGAGTPRKI